VVQCRQRFWFYYGSKDLFVHHSEIKSGGGYATLSDGQAVEYEVGQGEKGPCANNVVPA